MPDIITKNQRKREKERTIGVLDPSVAKYINVNEVKLPGGGGGSVLLIATIIFPGSQKETEHGNVAAASLRD